MMKRTFALILSILFILEGLPWQAFQMARAEEAYQINPGRLKAALALTGLEDNAAQWREDMEAGDCTNASQLIQVLDDLVEDYYEGVMDTFQDLYVAFESGEINTGEAERKAFLALYDEAMDLQDEISFYLDTMVEDTNQIYDLYEAIYDKDTDEDDAILFAMDVDENYEELQGVMDEVKNSIKGWTEKWEDWALILCGERKSGFPNAIEKFSIIPGLDSNPSNTDDAILLSSEKVVDPAKGNNCLDRLMPVRSALADTSRKVGVTVIDDRAFLIRTRENGKAVEGAKVTVMDIDRNGMFRRGKAPKSANTNNKGMIKLMVRDFSPSAGGDMWVWIEITKNGYRTKRIRKVSIGKGTCYNVPLEKDDGTPYVIEASFDKRDILNDKLDYFVTEKNGNTQTFSIEVSAQNNYTMDLYYVKDSKKTMLKEKLSGGKGTKIFTVKDKFSQKIPGDAKIYLALNSNGKTTTVQLKLNPIKAIVDEPITLPGMASIFNKNVQFTLPESWPGPLSKLKIQVDIPIVNKFPFVAMLLPNGMAYAMIGIKEGKKLVDLKNKDAQEMADLVKKAEKIGWKRAQEVKSGGGNASYKKLWSMSSMSLDWGLVLSGVGLLSGVKGVDSLRVLKNQVNVGVNIKMQGDIQCILYGILSFGVTGTINAIATFGVSTNVYFNKVGKNWKYKSWEFSGKNTRITIQARLELGLFVGLGYKGVVGVTLTGYGFLEETLNISFSGTTFELYGGFGARVTAQFFIFKTVYQIGDEFKWQLLPTFKRVSNNREILNRFIKMFAPAVAVADEKKPEQKAIQDANELNEKLIVRPRNTYTLDNAYNDKVKAYKIKPDGGNLNDYDIVFFLKKGKRPGSSKDVVDLKFFLEHSKEGEKSVFDKEFFPENAFNEKGQRFNDSQQILNAIADWDVYDYNVELVSGDLGRSHMAVITMFLAKDYREVKVGEGKNAVTEKIPKQTKALIMTRVVTNYANKVVFSGTLRYGNSFNPQDEYRQMCYLFDIASESDVPVCKPETVTELYGNKNWKYNIMNRDKLKSYYWIKLTCSPMQSAEASKIKTYAIKIPNTYGSLSAGVTKMEMALGAKYFGPEVKQYTYEQIRTSQQRIVGIPADWNYNPYLQDHWFAIARPKNNQNKQMLVVNYKGNNSDKNTVFGRGLIVLEANENVIDYVVFNNGDITPSGNSFVNNTEKFAYLVKDAKTGKTKLKVGDLKSYVNFDLSRKTGNGTLSYQNSNVIDFNMNVSTVSLNHIRIINADLFWWVETVAPDKTKNPKSVTWLVQGCWLTGDNADKFEISEPFTLAVIQETTEIASAAGPVCFSLYQYGPTIEGFYGVKYSNNKILVKEFTFTLTPSIDIINTVLTKDIAAPGSYDDVQIAIRNNGNMPISGFDIGFYGKEKIQSVHVDIENPNKSKVQTASGKTIPNNGKKQTGVRKVESGLAKNNEGKWNVESRFTRLNIPSNLKTIQKKYKRQTNLLLPGFYSTYVVTLQIPPKWDGDYDIEVRLEKIFARNGVNMQVHDVKTASLPAYLRVPPARVALMEMGKILMPFADAVAESPTVEISEQLPGMLQFSQNNGKTVITPVNDDMDSERSKTEDEFSYMELFNNDIDFDSMNLDTDIHDLEIDVDVWYDGEQEIATIYLTDDAYTSKSPQTVTLNAYIDEETEPSFTWVFDSTKNEYPGVRISDKMTWTLEIPVSVLTNGLPATQVLLTIAGDGYVEALSSNDYEIIYLDSGSFQIDLEPEDRTVDAGGTTTFSVIVSGGHRPYSYQWQVKLPNGEWTDIEDACTSQLTLYGVSGAVDGALYRCIIEDASGRVLTSQAAKLTVNMVMPDLPQTGDHEYPVAWIILLLVSGIGILALVISRKRRGK